MATVTKDKAEAAKEFPTKVEVEVSVPIGRAGKEKGTTIEVRCPSARDILECGLPTDIQYTGFKFDVVEKLLGRCTNIANPESAMNELDGRDILLLAGALTGFLL